MGHCTYENEFCDVSMSHGTHRKTSRNIIIMSHSTYTNETWHVRTSRSAHCNEAFRILKSHSAHGNEAWHTITESQCTWE